MPIGPVMMDLSATDVSAEEHELLQHPAVGGVIFFTRNYESLQQLSELVRAVRAACPRPLLLAVDHEGGRVQRFRNEFTRLPPLARLGQSYDENAQASCEQAERLGWLMAAELRSIDIDFSFAPVLDLNYGTSSVIGDRSLHQQPQAVTELANAYIQGMKAAGMASTGKHFPGHGYVEADSHVAMPVDTRSMDAIRQADLVPFARLIGQGLDAIMPAHVIYKSIDAQPAGFSRYWLQTILRGELGFDGVIFSDDLSMEGATVAGSYAERAHAALLAGCDMVLACNCRAGVIDIVDNLRWPQSAESAKRLERMRGRAFMDRSALVTQDRWQQTVYEIQQIA